MNKNFYIVPKSRYKEFAQICADSLIGNPLFTWICGGEYDTVKIKQAFISVLKGSSDSMLAIADSKEMNSVSIWYPEGSGIISSEYMKAGGWKLKSDMLQRLTLHDQYIKDVRFRQTDGKGWYLYIVATKPGLQRKGYSQSMINAMLNRIDYEGSFCYLESHSEGLTSYFTHNGFKLVESTNIPEAGEFTSYAMIRK